MRPLPFTERRKYARIAIKSKVLACLEDAGINSCFEEFRAIGKNIGAEGILFVSEKQLRSGTILTLKIDFPGDQDTLKIKGEVRWCYPSTEVGKSPPFYDTGVKFLEINKEHIRRLIKYVCGDMTEDLLPEAMQ